VTVSDGDDARVWRVVFGAADSSLRDSVSSSD